METVKSAKKATPPVKNYLREGLLALVPDYRSGYKSTVITKKKRHPDSRSVTWLAQIIAQYHCLDYSLMMKRGRSLLEQRHNISLAFTAGLVLVPVKLKVAKSQNELATGYISLGEIEKVVTMPAGPGRRGPSWLSKVIFKNGKQLFTLNSKKTLQERMRHGQIVLSDYQQRNGSSDHSKTLKPGELLKNTEGCDCPLYEIYLGKHTWQIIMDTLLKRETNLAGYSPKARQFLEYLRSASGENHQSIK